MLSFGDSDGGLEPQAGLPLGGLILAQHNTSTPRVAIWLRGALVGPQGCFMVVGSQGKHSGAGLEGREAVS